MFHQHSGVLASPRAPPGDQGCRACGLCGRSGQGSSPDCSNYQLYELRTLTKLFCASLPPPAKWGGQHISAVLELL